MTGVNILSEMTPRFAVITALFIAAIVLVVSVVSQAKLKKYNFDSDEDFAPKKKRRRGFFRK